MECPSIPAVVEFEFDEVAILWITLEGCKAFLIQETSSDTN